MPFESPDLGKLLFQIGSTMTAQRQQQEQINLKKQEVEATIAARADALKMQEKTLKMRQEQFEISTTLQAGQQGINAQNAATSASNAALSQDKFTFEQEGQALRDELTQARINKLKAETAGPAGGQTVTQRLALNSRLHTFGSTLAQDKKNLAFTDYLKSPTISAAERDVLAGFGTPQDMLNERVKLVHERDQNLVLGNADDDLPALKRINDQIAVMDKVRRDNPEMFSEPTAQDISAALGGQDPVLQQAYGVLSTTQAGMEARDLSHQLVERQESLLRGMEDLQKGNTATLAAEMRAMATTGGILDREKLLIIANDMKANMGFTEEQFAEIAPLILGITQ